MAVLREAAVVGATLSFSGSSALAALGNHFDVVIIDEAAQAVEPSTLIPLVAGCKQVGTGQIMRIQDMPAAQAGPAAAWTRQLWRVGACSASRPLDRLRAGPCGAMQCRPEHAQLLTKPCCVRNDHRRICR